jgi:hypothetical protein
MLCCPRRRKRPPAFSSSRVIPRETSPAFPAGSRSYLVPADGMTGQHGRQSPCVGSTPARSEFTRQARSPSLAHNRRTLLCLQALRVESRLVAVDPALREGRLLRLTSGSASPKDPRGEDGRMRAGRARQPEKARFRGPSLRCIKGVGVVSLGPPAGSSSPLPSSRRSFRVPRLVRRRFGSAALPRCEPRRSRRPPARSC